MLNWEALIPNYFYSGSNCRCNVCGFDAKKWVYRGSTNEAIEKYAIIGAGKRRVDCKKCGSSDRDRLVFFYFTELCKSEELENKRLLHVAPEKALSRALENEIGLEIVRIDARKPGYFFDYSNDVKTADLLNLPFENESFDFVICNHVLEHIPDHGKAVSEIHRILKKDGFAILQVPFSNKIEHTIEAESNWSKKERESKLGQWDHVRLYGPDFNDFISTYNFEPIQNPLILTSSLCNFYNININETLQLFKKISN